MTTGWTRNVKTRSAHNFDSCCFFALFERFFLDSYVYTVVPFSWSTYSNTVSEFSNLCLS